MELLRLHYSRCLRTKSRGKYCDLRDRERENNRRAENLHRTAFSNFSNQFTVGIRVFVTLSMRFCLLLFNCSVIFISDCLFVNTRCRDMQIKESAVGWICRTVNYFSLKPGLRPSFREHRVWQKTLIFLELNKLVLFNIQQDQ
jgi:cytochrome b subunit of formate dehydrogenase